MIDFNSLVVRFNEFWTEVSKRLGKRDLLKEQIENLRNQIETLNKQIEIRIRYTQVYRTFYYGSFRFRF